MSHKLWLIIIETTIQVKSLLYPDLKVFSSQTDIPGAWIGLTISLDSDADIIYKWEDGFPMTSTYWAANQPDQQNIGLYHNKNFILFFIFFSSRSWLYLRVHEYAKWSLVQFLHSAHAKYL